MVTDTVKGFAAAAEKKVGMMQQSLLRYFVLSMMAGIYVGFGIVLIFSIGGPLQGVGDAGLKAVMGASFGVALTLVIFAGSELFTGNNMIMVIGGLCKKVTWLDSIKLWVVCFAGNLAGSLLLALVIQHAGLLGNGTGHEFIAKVALAKGSGAFGALFLRGILCNMLVCLAVWTAARAKEDIAKIFLIFWCLFAFIGSGYEHSIANMTVIGIGMFVSPETVGWTHFWQNMIPVTLGNMVGGGIIIGAAYWYVASKSLKEE
ncbi:MAG: formate/nitrite transporter family protein [Planctomycetota bacterium]|jgi:nitrite transporter NirC